uniref:Uncharacterized protein n=1 Tax=Chromera velia CCMP2878 TaxID=1169474 RepID=A0A0G4I9J6_9ALVE|eukprot:Cvel_12263.t1-p1 / transcript=Cvel_12263.t1 / gene=Cvel_12263 / organism=Chromera_velia_CCMP2878 / gene_product=hypothetical protein / transcript_product=hypothetical protein / location=Cvel_scaffold794:37015-39207(-) / protein_length=253 / sequence_SO=supercontig / SO=protein_coding / is_pseudo=false
MSMVMVPLPSALLQACLAFQVTWCVTASPSGSYPGIDETFVIEDVEKDRAELDVGDLTDWTVDTPPNYKPKRKDLQGESERGRKREKKKRKQREGSQVEESVVDSAKKGVATTLVFLKWSFCGQKGKRTAKDLAELGRVWLDVLGSIGVGVQLHILDTCQLAAITRREPDKEVLWQFLLAKDEVDFLEFGTETIFPYGRTKPITSPAERKTLMTQLEKFEDSRGFREQREQQQQQRTQATKEAARKKKRTEEL